MALTLCGYELFVTDVAGAFHVSSRELPQLSVIGSTIGQALSRAQKAIDAIWAGRAQPQRA